MIAVSGARRSCASTPMNSSLTRIVSLRSSASCLARAARSRSAAWARFSSCTELRRAVSTCLRRAISAARSRDGWLWSPSAPDASLLPSCGVGDRDVRMLAADLADARAGRPRGERRHRVGAEQIERIDGAEIGPHLLEGDRGGVIRALPQEVDHLAVGAHLHPPIAARADGFDEAAHDPREQLSIGGTADHELFERRRRVQNREIAGGAFGLDVDVHGREASDELLAVRWRRDDHRGVAGQQRLADERGDPRRQFVVVLVEVHRMAAAIGRERRVIWLSRGHPLPYFAEFDDEHSHRYVCAPRIAACIKLRGS